MTLDQTPDHRKISEKNWSTGNDNSIRHSAFTNCSALERDGLVQSVMKENLWKLHSCMGISEISSRSANEELRSLEACEKIAKPKSPCGKRRALVLERLGHYAAFHKLQKLHERWRVVPVTNEYKRNSCEIRFREASSKINGRSGIKTFRPTERGTKEKPRPENRALRQRPRNWQSRADLHRKWNKPRGTTIEIRNRKAVGFAPKNNFQFRRCNACDKFFENKRNFYLRRKWKRKQPPTEKQKEYALQ